jgi:type IV secretory pathway component VirB8
MFPLETIKPYIIATEDIDRDVPQTMPLRLNPQQRVDEALVNYLLKDYVKNRESYNYNIEQIEARFSRIRQQSASEEFARYQALMDPQNRSSPLTYLSRDGYRKVTMSDYASFGLDFSQPEQRGQVYFTTITAKPGDEEARLQNWVADITFRFPPIQVDRETKRVMQWDAATNSYQLVNAITFTVVNYAVREQLTQTN